MLHPYLSTQHVAEDEVAVPTWETCVIIMDRPARHLLRITGVECKWWGPGGGHTPAPGDREREAPG